jgi:hypothetical protein
MKRSRVLPIIIGVIVALCLCGVLSIALSPGAPATPATSTSTVAPATMQPTVPEPTVPQPTATPAGFITREQLGEAWPFTVESGLLACNDQQHVTFTAGGVVYALNGTAKGAIDNGAPYQLIDTIWLDSPTPSTGPKVSLRSVLDIGLSLCK